MVMALQEIKLTCHLSSNMLLFNYKMITKV
nr:MAG TPA: hypothetical protein [Bacteriophage sp.]